jgi:hypothetical protein
VIEETTGGSDDEVDTLDESIGLGLAVRTSHDNPEGLRMVIHELLDDTEDLEGELSGRGNDDNSGS